MTWYLVGGTRRDDPAGEVGWTDLDILAGLRCLTTWPWSGCTATRPE